MVSCRLKVQILVLAAHIFANTATTALLGIKFCYFHQWIELRIDWLLVSNNQLHVCEHLLVSRFTLSIIPSVCQFAILNTKSSIISFTPIVCPYSSSFQAYKVDVFQNGRSHTLYKRYSEFEELHKQLKKVISTPEFPPKKVLKFNPKVLEQRRVTLELYLQVFIYLYTVGV